MNELLLQLVGDWRAATTDENPPDIDVLRSSLAEAAAEGRVALSQPEAVVAASFNPDEDWIAFVPIDSQAVAIVLTSTVELSDWTLVNADPRFWLNRATRLRGSWDDPDQIPFAIDAEDWVGSTIDDAWGESDWAVDVDGDPCRFDPMSLGLRYRDEPATVWPAGIYLDIAAGGTSMTTGDIGMSVSLDAGGNIWSSIWGCEEIFHGRADASFSPFAYLPAPPNEAVTLVSTVFNLQEMRQFVDYVAECVDEFDEETEVHCVGFTGTAAELIAATDEPS